MFNSAICLAGVLFAAGVGDEPVPPASAPIEFRQQQPSLLEQGAGLELNRALRLARSRDCDTHGIVARIAALGPEILPASLFVFDARRLPAIAGAPSQLVSDLQERLLLDAMSGFNPEVVWAAIQAHLVVPKSEVPSPAARRAAVLAAGACASNRELKRITAIALLPGEEAPTPNLELALRMSLERVFARTPEGLTELAVCWRGFQPSLLPSIVAAAGASEDPRALGLFSQVLNQPGDLESIALAQLSRQRAPSELPDGLLEQLRQRLGPADTRLSQSTCNALGSLGDFESVDRLVELLSPTSPAMSANAHRALCSMSGLDLPAQASSWRTWRVRESEWFTKRSAALELAIQTGNVKQAKEALQEISGHRWERHRLSDIVAQALRRPEPALGVLACSVLGQLGSPRGRTELQDALQSDEPSVVQAAREALSKYAVTTGNNN